MIGAQQVLPAKPNLQVRAIPLNALILAVFKDACGGAPGPLELAISRINKAWLLHVHV